MKIEGHRLQNRCARVRLVRPSGHGICLNQQNRMEAMPGKTHLLGLLAVVLVFVAMGSIGNESGQQTWAVQASPAGVAGGNLTTYLQEPDVRPARLVVVYSQRMSVAVYEIGREKGEIKFLSCRNLVFDLQMSMYNSDKPSPQEIKNMLDR